MVRQSGRKTMIAADPTTLRLRLPKRRLCHREDAIDLVYFCVYFKNTRVSHSPKPVQ